MSVIIFDAYGTLFDLDALEQVAAKHLGDVALAQRLCTAWRSKQLANAWSSVLMNRYQDFDKLTEQALLYALAQTKLLDDQSLGQQLRETHAKLPAYKDVAPALEQYEQQHKLTILSNGTFRGLQTMVSAADLLFSFDYLLSVEPIRSYKPARTVYQFALDTLACEKQDVVYVSSNQWDVTGAKSFGFRTIWLNRAHQPVDPAALPADGVIEQLGELEPYL